MSGLSCYHKTEHMTAKSVATGGRSGSGGEVTDSDSGDSASGEVTVVIVVVKLWTVVIVVMVKLWTVVTGTQ